LSLVRGKGGQKPLGLLSRVASGSVSQSTKLVGGRAGSRLLKWIFRSDNVMYMYIVRVSQR